jgi:ElaB/YqjD/DUF883 family membrane-anchored ribosome-binding protein
MASTSGSVPYPTSSTTTDDAASGMTGGTASTGAGSLGSSGTASGSGTASANGGMSSGAAAQPVIDRVAEKAHRVVDQLAGRAGPAVDRLRSTVSGARDSMGRHVEDLSHTRDEWMDSARESVRRHPIAAVGIAAAVGYLLARLTSHDR